MIAIILALTGPHLASLYDTSGYWTLQWYETAIFLAAAVALAGFCAWRVRHLAD